MSRNQKQGMYLGYSGQFKKHVRIRILYLEPFLPFIGGSWPTTIEIARRDNPEYLKPLPPSNYKC